MRFTANSILLVALAAGAAATPTPGGSHCKRNCSPGQIHDAFNAPSYIRDTKDFCRKFMHLPATIWVTKTHTSYVTSYYTYTKTTTGYPVTVTDVDVETKTTTNEETSVTTEVDVITVVETSTVLVTATSDVTETDLFTATEKVIEYTTITNNEVRTETATATSTVTKFQQKPYYYQPYHRQKKRDDIHIFKRGDYEYSIAYKIPSYLPQDLSPDQIGYACKKINPCTTKTTIITVPYYKTKTVVTWTTVTPTVSATVTVYETDVETNIIQKTVYVTETKTDIINIDVTTATVVETLATEVKTIEVEETDTITSTVLNTVVTTTTATVTVTKVATCNKGPAPCDLKYPESCCSGHCANIFKTPNCCVLKGQPCDIWHPEGCCSGKCKAQSYAYGKPVYTCF